MSFQSLQIPSAAFPANVRTDRNVLSLPSSDLRILTQQDVSVERLERVGHHLWMAGKPYLPRSLSTQTILDRQIIPTNDASLHLIWTTKKIFVKAVPEYMLSEHFFRNHLQQPNPCGPALGFLYSYLALVPTELDFRVAQESKLIPPEHKWTQWRAFTRRILETWSDQQIYQNVPRRYHYGELRLSRLNKIHRMFHADFLHGYSPLTSHTQYFDFLADNLGLITAATVYIVLVLSAMQVALGTKLTNNAAFQSACYGFSIFAIMAPLLAVALLVLLFVFMFTANLCKTLIVRKKRAQTLDKAQVDSYGKDQVETQLA